MLYLFVFLKLPIAALVLDRVVGGAPDAETSDDPRGRRRRRVAAPASAAARCRARRAAARTATRMPLPPPRVRPLKARARRLAAARVDARLHEAERDGRARSSEDQVRVDVRGRTKCVPPNAITAA